MSGNIIPTDPQNNNRFWNFMEKTLDNAKDVLNGPNGSKIAEVGGGCFGLWLIYKLFRKSKRGKFRCKDAEVEFENYDTDDSEDD